VQHFIRSDYSQEEVSKQLRISKILRFAFKAQVYTWFAHMM